MYDDRFGSAADKLIVCESGAAKTAVSKVIVSAPASPLAAVIASRSVHSFASHTPSPGSFAELTTNDVNMSRVGGGGAGCTSKAPMSTSLPTTRGKPFPRWSVVKGNPLKSTAKVWLPALITGDPDWMA